MTLLEYAFVGDLLDVWIVSKDGVRFHSMSSRRSQILRSVEELEGSRRISQGDRATTVLENLYRQLIPTDLSGHGKLVVVPDEFLTKVPFTALRNPLSGKYLVEEYSTSISPSANLYLNQHSRYATPSKSHEAWSFLAVSNPTVEGLWLSWLPGATSEAERIKSLFPGTDVISGRDLYKTPLTSMASGHEAIHFAGHWDLERTYDGGMALLPIGDQVRLVVLAACSTASNGLRAKKTDFGLAEPLLTRGVPAVITSLWNVDDKATSRLLIRFYEHFHAGKDTASALQAAQLDLLHGEDVALQDPFKWAGIQVIGYGGI
jgi:CHAT domain-containing protein